MFGQTALGSSAGLSDAASRMFRVEVQGLRQTYRSDKLSYPIRRSGSTFISVSYNRMNEEMQRINRLGGKIVSIQPLSADQPQAKSEATAAHQDAKATDANNAEATPASKG
ncbi:MAG TPA: phycobilisome linker polypeptide [Allocoleopsis sp.]